MRGQFRLGRGLVMGGCLLALAAGCGKVPGSARDGGTSQSETGSDGSDRSDVSGAGVGGAGDPGGVGGAPGAVGVVLLGGVTTVAAPPLSAGDIRVARQRISIRSAPTCLVGAAPLCLSGGITP
ncbi:MAG TPA: hypothetical protein VFH68_08670 [Polyangia bacterium]|nr:hypothetical protein [Polyangia bacterium]